MGFLCVLFRTCFSPNNILRCLYISICRDDLVYSLTAPQFSVVQIYHSTILNQSLVDGHLGYFTFFPTTSNAAVRVHVHTSIIALHLQGEVLGDELLSQRICAFKILIDISKFLLWVLQGSVFVFFPSYNLDFCYLVFI